MTSLLEIRDLSVEVGGKKVIRGINMSIEKRESMIMFGPNGSGKTSLLMTIMGIPGYRVTGGRIIFDGRDVTDMDIDERARLGLGIGFQQPPEITGVKLEDALKICSGLKPKEKLGSSSKKLADTLLLKDFLHRDVNVGFSGGERKRAEILQLLTMRPKLLLLDEPDSGVDVESLILIAGEIQRYLSKTKSSALIVTHQGHILEHVRVKGACVMMDGKIHCRGRPAEVFRSIMEKGYRGCVKCRKRRREQ